MVVPLVKDGTLIASTSEAAAPTPELLKWDSSTGTIGFEVPPWPLLGGLVVKRRSAWQSEMYTVGAHTLVNYLCSSCIYS